MDSTTPRDPLPPSKDLFYDSDDESALAHAGTGSVKSADKEAKRPLLKADDDDADEENDQDSMRRHKSNL